jgi:integrase
MRRGELLGLTWDAVDLDGGRLAVRQALSWVDGRAVIQPPKTRASRRVIPVPDVVVSALREHQKRQDAERADAGEKWEDTGFVFATGGAGRCRPTRWSSTGTTSARRLGTLRFHDLRHTAVSLLLAPRGPRDRRPQRHQGHDDRICLGVTAASHVDMVLGDGARERGALADEIPGDPAHAGIGFVIDTGSRLPVRFRAAFVDDDEIDELVDRCAIHPPVRALPERGEVA